MALALAALAAGCGGDDGSGDARRTANEPARHASPPPGRYVDAGGDRVLVRCSGEGRPTVVLEAGAGRDSSDWKDVQPEVARFTRVCSYDRPGLGRSEPTPGGRLADEGVAEALHRVLAEAGARPPLVLVGHSMGGLYVRLYERRYAGDVVGMVLVDSVDGARDGSLGEMPLVVLGQDPSRLTGYDGWTETQRELATLSKNSVLAIAKGSDHWIAQNEPKLVVESIRAVVAAARTRSDLRPCEEFLARVGGGCGSG